MSNDVRNNVVENGFKLRQSKNRILMSVTKTLFTYQETGLDTGAQVMSNDISKKAISFFAGKYNCAQAVFKAVLEYKGITLDKAADIASGFGAGITYSGQQCGAISGALMALGVLVGDAKSDVHEQKAETYRLSKEFHKRFNEKFGSIICDVLVDVKMSDGDAKQKAMDEGVFSKICPKFVGWSAETVLGLVG